MPKFQNSDYEQRFAGVFGFCGQQQLNADWCEDPNIFGNELEVIAILKGWLRNRRSPARIPWSTCGQIDIRVELTEQWSIMNIHIIFVCSTNLTWLRNKNVETANASLPAGIRAKIFPRANGFQCKEIKLYVQKSFEEHKHELLRYPSYNEVHQNG